jgi:hypothetical protein
VVGGYKSFGGTVSVFRILVGYQVTELPSILIFRVVTKVSEEFIASVFRTTAIFSEIMVTT